MLNWKHIDACYIYDGTFDGLLTIVFDCYSSIEFPLKIVSSQNYKPNLLDNCIQIKTDFKKSKRILNSMIENISYDTWYNSYHAFLSEDPFKEINILKYLCLSFKIGSEATTMVSLDYVLAVIKLRRKVILEVQKLKGFTRFIEIGENLYMGTLHPDNNILEILGEHFVNRLPTQNLILVDKNRDLAFLYNLKEHCIISSNDLTLPKISDAEKEYQDLWKLFFNTISIKERKNYRLQLQFMPRRYWKDLIEI